MPICSLAGNKVEMSLRKTETKPYRNQDSCEIPPCMYIYFMLFKSSMLTMFILQVIIEILKNIPNHLFLPNFLTVFFHVFLSLVPFPLQRTSQNPKLQAFALPAHGLNASDGCGGLAANSVRGGSRKLKTLWLMGFHYPQKN